MDPTTDMCLLLKLLYKFEQLIFDCCDDQIVMFCKSTERLFAPLNSQCTATIIKHYNCIYAIEYIICCIDIVLVLDLCIYLFLLSFCAFYPGFFFFWFYVSSLQQLPISYTKMTINYWIVNNVAYPYTQILQLFTSLKSKIKMYTGTLHYKEGFQTTQKKLNNLHYFPLVIWI